jgi:hypothetical protein
MSNLSTNEKLALMSEVQQIIVDYLEDQKSINEDALKAYDQQIIQDGDPEIRRMRENEAIKLRDRVNELKKHISVVKRMFPDGIKKNQKTS